MAIDNNGFFLIGLSIFGLSVLLSSSNNTLRPKIESPIRKKPLLYISIAAGIGLLIGTLLNSGRK